MDEKPGLYEKLLCPYDGFMLRVYSLDYKEWLLTNKRKDFKLHLTPYWITGDMLYAKGKHENIDIHIYIGL